jgi:ribosomal protein L35
VRATKPALVTLLGNVKEGRRQAPPKAGAGIIIKHKKKRDIMPKLKTNKAMKKRIHVSKSGKIRRKRNLRRAALVSRSESQRTRRMLPYG